MSDAPRLAVVCDFPEEGWASMDLVAEMLLAEIAAGRARGVRAARVCPRFRRRATAAPWLRRRRSAVNADRASISAPAASSDLTAFARSSIAAHVKAVVPVRVSRALTVAPWFTSCVTASTRPVRDASISAVCPSGCAASARRRSAPASKSRSSSAALP